MTKLPKWKISLYAMIALYLGAGVYHFINPGFYYSVMPDWLPRHELANISGGIVEIILALLLVPGKTRRFSAGMIIAMLSVFLFVIHIPMVIHFYGQDSFMFWVSVIRIPLQLVLINWAWKFARPRQQA